MQLPEIELPHLAKDPQIPDSVYVDRSARINGDVTMGEHCSVWFNVSIRGDVNTISIGRLTNIQDNSCFHNSYLTTPLIIGDEVTVGHQVLLHGCTIGNRVLVGMQSIVMDNAVIGDDCILGAGSLVTEGKEIPAGSLAFGRPAKVIRQLTDEERKMISDRAIHYAATIESYRKLGKFQGWQDHPLRDGV